MYGKKNRSEELREIMDDVNQAKDRLNEVYYKLLEAGFERKANSCFNLILKIEEWQNRG